MSVQMLRIILLIAPALAAIVSPQVTVSEWEWKTAAPESQGISSRKLDELKENLAARRTTGFLVIRNDHIVYEWYAQGHSAARPHYTASMAKALVGGVSTALALSDGRIALDDPVAKHLPQWRGDPLKAAITVRHLGSHVSGIEDAEADHVPHDKLTGWKGDFWKRHDPPVDPFTISRDTAPVLFKPGERFQYSNPGIAMLGYVLAAALKNSPQTDLRTLLRERVMRPIAVPDEEWSVGYGKTLTVDGLPLVAAWGGGSYTARAVARVGRLMLRKGDWEGRQLISETAVRQVTSDAGTPGNCGIGWWSNNDGSADKVPRDAFWGSGAGHQVVFVVPSLNLIAVRNGESLDPEFDRALQAYLFEPLMDTIIDEPRGRFGAAPYPPSPVIDRIVWAPKESILRKARGSDNWPMTWADDDALYAAYGDGNGFQPFLSEKLSLGLAKVLGSPPEFSGINLRSASIEQKGDGERGMKASGALFVGNRLYLWLRNAGNSQLAWSGDHGATWTWSDWKFTTSFGCPTFLNFGGNYAGARDRFVYVYSHDSDSAYTPADRMVLARVPKDRILQRGAYEFFLRLRSDGSAEWTKEISHRGAVFRHAGKCYRSGVTFNAALRRYLWSQVLPASTHPQGPRFQGGFGIYDAPEPWGPWTTVFYTEAWDVGPGETSSFPTKWMSPDGKILHLVFSGDDCFSVRKATLVLRGERARP